MAGVGRADQKSHRVGNVAARSMSVSFDTVFYSERDDPGDNERLADWLLK